MKNEITQKIIIGNLQLSYLVRHLADFEVYMISQQWSFMFYQLPKFLVYINNGKQIIIQNEEPQIRRLYRQEPSKTEYVVISKLQEANQQKIKSERNIIFQPMIKVISKHMCKAHGRKMMYFSLERKVFLCDICEKGEEALYIMEQLHMPASDLYYPLHDLLIGDTDFLQDIQNTFQYYKEHNQPFNPSGVQDALNQLYLEIKQAALNFKDIQRSYLALLTTGNFEELLIQHGTWSSQIYDFQSKFLDPQQLKQSIDKYRHRHRRSSTTFETPIYEEWEIR